PREPSLLVNMGAPVVIGPMNGGMSYPPGFRGTESRFVRTFVDFARKLAPLVNYLLSGKRHAATLLVANQRTRDALPAGLSENVVTLVDNGLDLTLWRPPAVERPQSSQPPRFLFAGRFEALKGIDLLLEAFATVAPKTGATLDIYGDGPLRPIYEAQARELKL